MKRILVSIFYGFMITTAFAGNVGVAPLDNSVVGTPGAGTIAAAAGTVYSGCWIQNDPNNGNNLIVDTLNTANYSSPSATAASLVPGQVYTCPGGMTSAVTVDAVDAGHKFYGVKY